MAGDIDVVVGFPITALPFPLEYGTEIQVVGIDLAPRRLELAMELGAAHTIDAGDTEDVVGAIRALTGGKGPDLCIEAAGNPTTAQQCFDAVRTGGTVVFNGEQPALPLSPSEHFIRRDITALGIWFYHFSEFGEMLALYREGLPVEKLVRWSMPA